jgi:hypothetical protein
VGTADWARLGRYTFIGDHLHPRLNDIGLAYNNSTRGPPGEPGRIAGVTG